MKETLWEVSFECGNKVGGIWTVITSKAPFIKRVFPNYFTVGFYNPKRTEVVESPVPPLLKRAFSALKKEGIDFHYGSWVDADGANIILVDSQEFEERQADKIKGELWEKYELDSLGAGKDFSEPLAWGYAAGKLLDEVTRDKRAGNIVQLHEWLSGGALLYLKDKLPTVFTTHATVLGRSLGGTVGSKPEEAAKEKNVLAKHLLEKLAAKHATVFTTVSESTAEEARKVLGRPPDFITYNSLDFQSIPDLPKLISDKAVFRKEIDDFVRAYFFPYYSLSLDDYQVVYTAGRYEFKNKGYDIFIDALGEVNKRLKKRRGNKWFLALILVPTGTLGVKDEVIQNFSVHRRMKEVLEEDAERLSETLYQADVKEEIIEKGLDSMVIGMKRMISKLETRRGRNPPLSAFRLSCHESEDQIIQRLKQNELLNRPEDKVKVVYYPVYINRQDELLGLSYRDFLTAASMGVFMSRYEPWGYTPMEAAGFLSTAVTSENSGFGRAVANLGKTSGIFMAKDSVSKVADIIEKFVTSSKEVRISLEIGAHKTVKEHFVWDKAGANYVKAYKKAQESP